MSFSAALLKPKIRIAVALALLAALMAAPADACKCATPYPPVSPSDQLRHDFAESNTVFIGTVLNRPHRLVRHWRLFRYMLLVLTGRDDLSDREHRAYDRRVKFQVHETLKGSSLRTVKLLTGWGSGDCGYPLQKGTAYVVFADQIDTGQLVTSTCHGTAEFLSDQVDIELLRSLVGPNLTAAVVPRRLTPRCSGPHPGIRPCVAAELIRR